MRYFFLCCSFILIGFCSCEKKETKTEEAVTKSSFYDSLSIPKEVSRRPRFNDTSFYEVIGSKFGDYALIKVINYSDRIAGVGIVNMHNLVPIGEWYSFQNEGSTQQSFFFDKQGKNKRTSSECDPPSIFLDSIGISGSGKSMLFFSDCSIGSTDKAKIKLRLIYEDEERTDSLVFKTRMHPFINVELKGKLPSHIQYQSENDVPDTVYSYPTQRPFHLDTIKRVKQPKKLLEFYTKTFSVKDAGKLVTY